MKGQYEITLEETLDLIDQLIWNRFIVRKYIDSPNIGCELGV